MDLIESEPGLCLKSPPLLPWWDLSNNQVEVLSRLLYSYTGTGPCRRVLGKVKEVKGYCEHRSQGAGCASVGFLHWEMSDYGGRYCLFVLMSRAFWRALKACWYTGFAGGGMASSIPPPIFWGSG